MFQRFFSARPKPSNPGSWSNIWTSSMKTTKIQAGHDWNLWMGWKLTSSCRYTSIAARGGGGSFKREKIYNSEEQVPIEFVRVTCFNNAHFEDFFFQHVRIAGACNVSVCRFWHPNHRSTVTVLQWWGCQKCLSGRCPKPTTLHLSRSSPQRHTTTVVGDICSWVSFFKTHTFKDLVEAVRKDIRQLTTHGSWRPTDPLRQLGQRSPQRHTILLLDFLFVFVAAVRKDIRPEETFTFRSPTLNKHNHCSPQRHTILLLDFLFVFVAAVVRKDIRPEETFTVRCPIREKPNHCSPQRHTILLWDYLLCSWPQSANTYDLKKHLLSDLLHLTNTTIAVRKDIQYCF